MRIVLTLLIALGIFASDGHTTEAGPGTSSKIDLSFLDDKFEEAQTLRDIPENVRKILSGLMRSEKIADKGERYEKTDYLTDPALPRRRLSLAAHSPNLWIIQYDHGGYARHSHIVGIAHNQISGLIFNLYSGPSLQTIGELLRHLKNEKLFSACSVAPPHGENEEENVVHCYRSR
jgi:hypothetical protein